MKNTNGNRRRRFIKQVAGIGALGMMQQFPTAKGMTAPQHGATNDFRIRRLSWAGLQLEKDGTAVFIDPWISSGIWGGRWTLPIIPIETEAKSREVLITHLHSDHFDQAALKQILASGGRVVCHHSIATPIVSRGFQVRSFELFEPHRFGPFTITPVPAVDGLGEHQVSWVIASDDRKIIHCGDTLWHGHWWTIGAQFGPFDKAFMPINGALFLFQSPQSHIPATMTPRQSIAAAQLLGAGAVVPIHYGFHAPGFYEEYPDAEKLFIKSARERNIETGIVTPGDWVGI